MTIHPAFQGHGTFCYMPDQIARYYKHYPRGFETSGMFGRLRGLFRPAHRPRQVWQPGSPAPCATWECPTHGYGCLASKA